MPLFYMCQETLDAYTRSDSAGLKVIDPMPASILTKRCLRCGDKQ